MVDSKALGALQAALAPSLDFISRCVPGKRAALSDAIRRCRHLGGMLIFGGSVTALGAVNQANCA